MQRQMHHLRQGALRLSADTTLLAVLRSFRTAMQTELTAIHKLLECTTKMYKKLARDVFTDKRFHAVAKQQTEAFREVERREQYVQRVRSQLQHVLSIDEWHWEALQRAVRAAASSENEAVLLSIMHSIDTITKEREKVLNQVQKVSTQVEQRLKHNLSKIGGEAQDLSRSRRATSAYSPSSDVQGARFIDQRK